MKKGERKVAALNPVAVGEVGRVDGFTLVAFDFETDKGGRARALFRVRSIYDRQIDQAIKHLVPMWPHTGKEVPFLTA